MSRPTQGPATQPVSRARLASGSWDFTCSREVGKGDISAAYSADVIALHGRVRAPFRFGGGYWVTVALRGSGTPEAEAYRLVAEAFFAGPAQTYGEKVRVSGGDAARSDPHGFYHGMRVRWQGDNYVLAGPPLRFVADGPDPVQGDLFAGGAS